MYPALIFFITLCTFGLSTASNGNCQLYTVRELFLNRFVIPRETKSPIDINTKNVTRVNYSPLYIVASLDEKLTLKNNGKSVEAFKNNPKTKSYLTGGVLRTCKFIFHKFEFLWTDNENGACGTTIDGKGYPVHSLLYYFNSKYKTFEQALHYRDGIVLLVVPVAVGCEPNKDFDCFAQKMKQVQKPGYSTPITYGNIIKWFGTTQTNSTIYAYAGEYDDLSAHNHTVYFCKTVIFFRLNPPRSISHEQFETFLRMKNCFNKSYINIQKVQPARQIVVESKGYNLKTIGSSEDFLGSLQEDAVPKM